jgi:long-chain acyl-CoA synthetase
MFTIHAPAATGAAVYYAESIDKLRDNLVEVKPTVFFAVPRVWEKFYNGVYSQMGHLTGAKAKIAGWAQGVGRAVADAKNRGDSPSPLLAMQATLADKLVWGKVKEALGMTENRIAVSGAAPVSKEILEFLSGFGLIVLEVYGQSEDSGPTTFNLPGRTKFGTVGPAYPGVEVKIADDGEILAKGRNVFLGYYKDEAATKETLADGWLYSGDLGEFDDDGFLTITGRKKDILITAGGKNVAPKPMEAGLKNHLLVSEAVVVGDARKFLAALITLDPEEAKSWADAHGIEGNPHDHPDLLAEVQKAVDELNADLARVEQIKKFTILPRELSIEAGELTPTLKVKRARVNEAWSDTIDAMYRD